MDTSFSLVGEWVLDGDSIEARGELSSSQCLYAFFVDGDDCYSYIGLTTRMIREKMRNIRNADESQPTNPYLKANIIQALKSGKRVEIHEHIPNTGASLNDLKMQFIRQWKPAWNRQGK